MSESFSIHQVSTTPIPFGVSIKWKWPEASHWLSRLELQYLLSDGRLEKELIRWPVTEKHISGLKAGERLQVRLRPVAYDGSARDWRASDWIEGVTSVDAGEIVEALTEEIRNSCALHGLEGGWSFEKNGTLAINNGQVFITDAKIGDAVVSQNYSVKLNVAVKGREHEAGMALGVEGDQSKVVFEADRFKVHEAASSIIASVTTSAKTKISLSDELKQAIIDAVRESDLFTAIQVNIDAQAASLSSLQQAMHEAVTEAIKNALKPGGLLYKL
ncbi:phage tail tip fiber protein [Enterobacter hormaechei]|uniref:phage tail tip fiber protein n=1 Tax=Enterobacter hormaechei TaxID=158836 RepID=UPI003F4A1F14